MKENSRIRFSPTTKEVEIEGSEAFVKAMFNKIQEIMPGAPKVITKEPKRPSKRALKKPRTEVLPHKGVRRVIKVQEKVSEITLFDKIVAIIQASHGITTAELKEKTGLSEKQIWGIAYRAAKLGTIKKSKRGIYEAAT